MQRDVPEHPTASLPPSHLPPSRNQTHRSLPASLRAIVRQFLNLFRINRSYETPLARAVSTNDFSEAQRLLFRHAPVREVLPHGREPIHVCLNLCANPRKCRDAFQILVLLVSHGALHGPFSPHLYPPRSAVLAKTHHALIVMLNRMPRETHNHELQQMDVPRQACETGHLPSLKALLSWGIDVRAVDQHGSSILHHACNAPHIRETTMCDVVQVILETGRADLAQRDTYGRTPLQIARARHMKSVVQLFMRYGAVEQSYTQLLLRRAAIDQSTELPKSRFHIDVASFMPAYIPSPTHGSLQCPICLDAIVDHRAVLAPCAHAYHVHCLNRWATKSPCCPTCKQTLIRPQLHASSQKQN